MKYTVKLDNETIDSIVFKHYGSSFGYLELVLKTNIFLYRESIFLKEGAVIELPNVEKEAQSRVKLWS